MINERLMKAGRFDIKLWDDAPYSLWSRVSLLDHIVITPTRFDPTQFSDAQILSAASYTGVVTAKPDTVTISGQGLAWWLATDEGLGDLLDTDTALTSGTLSSWVTALLPASIAVGSVSNTATSTLSYVFRWTSRREAFDFMCRAVGAEWRVNPNFTLDAGHSIYVFTPTSIITRKPEGSDGSLTGFEVQNVNMAQDIRGYTTKVLVVGQVGDSTAPESVGQGSATGSTTYKDGLNNTVVFERLVNAPNSPLANLNGYATNILNMYGQIRRPITLTTNTYDISSRVACGDWIWVYDQRADLFDTANQVVWRGEVIAPIKQRVRAYTWPVQKGMGVYLRESGSPPVYVDLSDWVQWEDGQPTEWEVGSTTWDPEQNPEMLQPAYLGDQATILGRVHDPPWLTYAPTTTNISGGSISALYRLRGKWMDIKITVTAGTATAAGFVSFSVPSGWTPSPTVQPIHALYNGSTVVTGQLNGVVIRLYKTAAAGGFTAADSLTSSVLSGTIAIA